MNAALILALGWLAVLMLAFHANVPAPDGFGLAILALTLSATSTTACVAAGRLPAGSCSALSSACSAAAAAAPAASSSTTTSNATTATTATIETAPTHRRLTQ
jgi:hypothetical protein